MDSRPLALVIEEDAISRKFLCIVLESWGWAVHSTPSGREALEKSINESYDLILAEYLTTDIAGDELLRRIRSNGASRRARIVAVTATDDKAACLAAGANQYLRKPVSIELLAGLARPGSIDYLASSC